MDFTIWKIVCIPTFILTPSFPFCRVFCIIHTSFDLSTTFHFSYGKSLKRKKKEKKFRNYQTIKIKLLLELEVVNFFVKNLSFIKYFHFNILCGAYRSRTFYFLIEFWTLLIAWSQLFHLKLHSTYQCIMVYGLLKVYVIRPDTKTLSSSSNNFGNKLLTIVVLLIYSTYI